ncbi:MAG: hypothetical protein NT049_18765 [Planctomycetota bacterium]|nr:hypothetical protein [Planctomycetota bacterium]
MNASRIVFYSIAPLALWALAGMAASVWMPQYGDQAMASMTSPRAAQQATAPVAEAPKPQTKCPIKGGAINKKLYADVEGYRVYVCCSGCLEKVRADPKAALDKIRANGEEPEKLPPPPKP